MSSTSFKGACVTCLLFCRQQPQQLVSIMSQSEWDSHFRSLRILQILQQQKMPRAASPPAACLNNVSLNVSMSHSSLSSSLSQFVSKLWNCLIQFNKIFLQFWNVDISQGYADTKQVHLQMNIDLMIRGYIWFGLVSLVNGGSKRIWSISSDLFHRYNLQVLSHNQRRLWLSDKDLLEGALFIFGLCTALWISNNDFDKDCVGIN